MEMQTGLCKEICPLKALAEEQMSESWTSTLHSCLKKCNVCVFLPRGLERGENFSSTNHVIFCSFLARNCRDNSIFQYCGSIGPYEEHVSPYS